VTDWASTRRALYAGERLLLPPTDASLEAVDAARALLARELGLDDVRRAHERLSPEALFERIGRVRRALFLEPSWHDRVREVIAACGVEPGGVGAGVVRCVQVDRARVHRDPRIHRRVPLPFAASACGQHQEASEREAKRGHASWCRVHEAGGSQGSTDASSCTRS